MKNVIIVIHMLRKTMMTSHFNSKISTTLKRYLILLSGLVVCVGLSKSCHEKENSTNYSSRIGHSVNCSDCWDYIYALYAIGLDSNNALQIYYVEFYTWLDNLIDSAVEFRIWAVSVSKNDENGNGVARETWIIRKYCRPFGDSVGQLYLHFGNNSNNAQDRRNPSERILQSFRIFIGTAFKGFKGKCAYAEAYLS